MDPSPSFNNYQHMANSVQCTPTSLPPVSWVILKQIPDLISFHSYILTIHYFLKLNIYLVLPPCTISAIRQSIDFP